MNNQALRHKVKLLYDFQRLRIQTAGRTNNPTAVVHLEDGDRDFLADVAKDLASIEKDVEKAVHDIVNAHPLWITFLEKQNGIAEKTAGVIIGTIDIHKANTPSALWMYTGLGVVPHVQCSKCSHKSWNNKGTCQKVMKSKKNKKTEKTELILCGAVTVPITDDAGKMIKGKQRAIEGEKIGYNKWLKSKLLGVIGPNLLRANNPYRKFYDDYKARLEAKNWGKSKGHRHNASIRYMVKMFLIDLWKAWREIEGLPVREAYAVEYLGKKH